VGVQFSFLGKFPSHEGVILTGAVSSGGGKDLARIPVDRPQK